MSLLGAVLAGAVVGLGVLVAAVAAFGQPSLPAALTGTALPAWAGDRLALRAALAAMAAVVLWLATGWPAGAAMAAIAAGAAPSLLGGKARRAAAVARIEAIAGWAEQLRDVMAAADGIQSAIVASATLAPEPVRAEVRRLAQRLSRHDGLAVSLRQFAQEAAHPLTDMIVTALTIAAGQGGQPGPLLGEVALAARRTATMRLRVEAARARTYVTTRLIIGVTAAMAAWLVLLQRDYLEPFDTAGGQVMLVVIGAVFVVSGVAMQRMARPTEPARLLAGAEEQGWR